MNKTTQIENFDMVNGLGTISFSPELITSIIKKILSSYHGYEYISHNIGNVDKDYYEVSICVDAPKGPLNFKEIDRMQKELMIVIKQSLSLTCVVILNINHEQ